VSSRGNTAPLKPIPNSATDRTSLRRVEQQAEGGLHASGQTKTEPDNELATATKVEHAHTSRKERTANLSAREKRNNRRAGDRLGARRPNTCPAGGGTDPVPPPPGKDLGENGGGARPSTPKKTQEAGGALSGSAVPGATSKLKPGRQCLRTKTEGGGTPQHNTSGGTVSGGRT
jgi:hypothetical protein